MHPSVYALIQKHNVSIIIHAPQTNSSLNRGADFYFFIQCIITQFFSQHDKSLKTYFQCNAVAKWGGHKYLCYSRKNKELVVFEPIATFF